jgi:hypothetical protein
MTATQSADNHARVIPVFHRFALPVLMINVAYGAVQLVRSPSIDSGWAVLVALAMAIGVLYGRVQALSAQDRVIRLEETLRLERLLPVERRGEIGRRSRSDFIALRFASDEELPALVTRVLAGEFAKPIEIKRAIRNWRADHLRV